MCLQGCCGLVCVFRLKKKTNFESFSVGQNLFIFQKKHTQTQIFATFFFDPTLFSAGNRQTAKKSHWPFQMTKMLAKKVFMTF